MPTPVTAYAASDGKVFATNQAALDYETSLTWRAQAVTFAASAKNPYPLEGDKVQAIVIAWEQWKTA